MNFDERSSKRLLKKKLYSWFASELSFLSQNGILPLEIKDRILDHYELEPNHQMDRHRLWLITFSTLGVLMFGFAVFLLICYNWNYLAPLYRMLITVGSLALCFGLGTIFKATRKGILSELFYFFTGILFGVNIWQVAQIYHFPIDFHFGFWLWGLGLLLLAFGRKLPILHYLAVVVLAIWIPSEITSHWFSFPLFYEDFPPIPAGAYSLPILAGFGYYCGRKNGWTSVCLFSFFLFVWWTLCLPFAARIADLFPFYFIFLGGLFLMSFRFPASAAVSSRMRDLGGFFLFCFIPFLTFRSFFQISRGSSYDHSLIPFILEGLVFLALIIFQIVPFLRATDRKDSDHKQSFHFLPAGFALLFIPLFLLIYLYPDSRVHSIVAILSSFIMLGCALWGIKSAFPAFSLRKTLEITDPDESFGCEPKENRKEQIFSGSVLYWFGILYFILWAVFRYIDLFAESFGMPGAAAMFALIGILLIAAGWFRARRLPSSSTNLPEKDQSAKNDFSALDSNPDEEQMKAIPFQPDLPLTISEKIVLILAFLFMFGTVATMIGSQVVPFRNAKKITVETVPVDPRSLFRGDYVILNYSFSSINNRSLSETNNQEDLFDTSELRSDHFSPHRNTQHAIFTTLRFDPKKKIWIPRKMNLKYPENISEQEIVIKGRLKYRYIVQYGIEQYFVQQGSGRTIEQAIRSQSGQQSKVLVDLWVAPDGQARIADVRIVEK